MSSALDNLFNSNLNHHGHFNLASPEMLWLNAISDGIISITCLSVAMALYFFLNKRPDLKFRGLIIFSALLFALFGLSHAISIFSLWHDISGIYGICKFLIAIVACITAYKVYSSIPRALQLSNPDHIKKTLENANEITIQTLRASHHRDQRILRKDSINNIHTGILVLQPDGVIDTANVQVCTMLGYDSEELQSKFIGEVIDIRDIHTFLGLNEQCAGTDDTEEYETQPRFATRKNGSQLPVKIKLARSSGIGNFLYVSVEDMSEQLATESALFLAKLLTDKLIVNLPMGIHIYEQINNNYQLIHENNRAKELLEQTNLTDFTALPEIQSFFTENNAPSALMVTLPGPPPNKSLKLNVFSATQVHVVMMFSDVTEQRHFEAQLIEKESINRRVIDASIAGVYIYDVIQRRNLFINAQFSVITGYTHAHLDSLEDGIKTLIHPHDRQRMSHHIEHLLRNPDTKDVVTIQYRVKHANGSWIWVMAQDAVFENGDDGKVSKLIGSLLDITSLKTMQDKLRALKETAEQANSSKSEFLANMSHEIRTPMNAVIALTDMVLEMEMAGKQREYLKKIQMSSRSLLQLLNDILDYSKLEAGKVICSNEPFDLFKMLSNSLNLFSSTASQKNLTLHAQVEKEVPRFVIGDAKRIGQIINNLLGNATKFTEKGGITLRVSATNSTVSAATFVKFSIADTGIGIDSTQLTRLFQSFSQADSSIERRFGGTGLGLAISKKLCDLLNGDISVESQLGKGSQFTLQLPLVIDTNSHSLVASRLKNLNITLLTNDTGTAEMLERFLDNVGAATQRIELSDFLNSPNAPPCDVIFVDMNCLTRQEKENTLTVLLKKRKKNLSKGVIFISDEKEYYEKVSNIKLNVPSTWLLRPFLASDMESSLLTLLENNLLRPTSFAPSPSLQFEDATVLVVEDHPTNQFVATELLEQLGITVVLANNGMEAISELQGRPVDLVLMDLQMPVMDGYTACERIRTMPSGKNTPIYAMSAAVTAVDHQRVVDIGMDGQIGKPIVRDELYGLLIKVLSDKRVTASMQSGKTLTDDTRSQLQIAALLPDFDVAGACERLGFCSHTYLDLLTNFKLHFGSFNDALLKEKDSETLRRMLHTLKGLSVSIGALHLQTQVREAEELLNTGQWTTKGVLLESFNETYRAISRALESSSLGNKELHAATPFEIFKANLREHKYMNRRYIVSQRPTLTARFGSHIADAIIEAAAKFDFKQALALIANEEGQ